MSMAGPAIGSLTTSAATSLPLGGRPRRGFGERSVETCMRSGCAGAGSIRLGRIRRDSAAGACRSAGDGQDTAGRGVAGAVARCGMRVRWLRPPDLFSTVNDRDERLRMGLNASSVRATGHAHEDAGAALMD